MKESARAALTYAKANAERFGIAREVLDDSEIHIHVPSGGTPKEGPSAGIALATSLISALTGVPVRRDVAMTGEVTLRGRVLPIGGLREKILGAKRAGIRHVIYPAKNHGRHEGHRRADEEVALAARGRRPRPGARPSRSSVASRRSSTSSRTGKRAPAARQGGRGRRPGLSPHAPPPRTRPRLPHAPVPGRARSPPSRGRAPRPARYPGAHAHPPDRRQLEDVHTASEAITWARALLEDLVATRSAASTSPCTCPSPTSRRSRRPARHRGGPRRPGRLGRTPRAPTPARCRPPC